MALRSVQCYSFKKKHLNNTLWKVRLDLQLYCNQSLRESVYLVSLYLQITEFILP